MAEVVQRKREMVEAQVATPMPRSGGGGDRPKGGGGARRRDRSRPWQQSPRRPAHPRASSAAPFGPAVGPAAHCRLCRSECRRNPRFGIGGANSPSQSRRMLDAPDPNNSTSSCLAAVDRGQARRLAHGPIGTADRRPSSEVRSAAPAPTSPACRARTRSAAPRSLRPVARLRLGGRAAARAGCRGRREPDLQPLDAARVGVEHLDTRIRPGRVRISPRLGTRPADAVTSPPIVSTPSASGERGEIEADRLGNVVERALAPRR